MDNEKFSIKKIYGSPNTIYRFVDNNNNMGRTHFSHSKYTPLSCQMDEKGAYVELCNRKFYINSLQELDAINNALNNYKKSRRALINNQEYFYAEENRESALQIVYAIRQAIFEHEDTLGKMGVYNELKSVNQFEDDIMILININTAKEQPQNKETIKTNQKTIPENENVFER